MATPAETAVIAAYADLGRTGIGDKVSQIDQGGFDYWVGQINSGALTLSQFPPEFRRVITSFILNNPGNPYVRYSETYLMASQPMPPTDVTALYRAFLGRYPDVDGLAYWTQRFSSGIGPQQVLEFQSNCRPELIHRGLVCPALDPNVLSALGDSTTWGYNSGVRVTVNMIDAAQSRLAGLVGTSITFNNYGVNSTTLGDCISNGTLTKALNDNSSVVVINFGLNEAYRTVSQAEFDQNLVNACNTLRGVGKKVILQAPNYTEAIARVQDYAATVEQVAQSLSVPFDDKYAFTKPLYPQFSPNDPVHPTEPIYQSLGVHLADLIAQRFFFAR